jgi:hypothetical protein
VYCPEIPTLHDYSKSPPESFWESFPYNPLPDQPISNVKHEVLAELVSKKKQFLTLQQCDRAYRCIDNLREGASSFQKCPLPSLFLQNADSTFQYGKEVTDTIGNWVKKGFASGPFEAPPLKNFRANTLIAIPQGEKVRPVLNLSEPKNCSFNSNVCEPKLEKVYMSSVKKFSETLFRAGIDAKMYKFDLVDAYKNIPAKTEDFRIQGFSWLNRYFVETKQIFGAKTAVCNFDVLGNTILALTLCDTNVPRQFVHRTLDDVPVVVPAHQNWGETFAAEYISICSLLNVSVTTDCPKFEKAFMDSKYGKVLGIWFNSENLTWCLPFDKTEKTLLAIKIILEQEWLDLKSFQKLMGRLNHVSQLSNLLRGFKFNLNKLLGRLQVGESAKLSAEARKELILFANFLSSSEQWHKIDPVHYSPPLRCYEFISDAAGSVGAESDIGCGNIGFNEDGVYIFAKQVFWPSEFLEQKDSEGAQYGQKTTTLEFFGILLPFLLIPEQLVNRYIVVKMDNSACYFGWINRHSAGDATASIFIRTLHMISITLNCDIHIEHLPRMSSWEAQLVDRISRKKTTLNSDRDLLCSFALPDLPDCLKDWLKCPVENWGLCSELLAYVVSRLE